MSKILNLATRPDCRRCDLWLPGSGRCRATAIAEPPAHPLPPLHSGLPAPRSYFDLITSPPPTLPAAETGAWLARITASCGSDYTAANAYLAGEEQTCGAWQERRRSEEQPAAEPEQADFSDILGSPFSAGDL